MKKWIRLALDWIINIFLLLFAFIIMQIPTLAEFVWDFASETAKNINLGGHVLTLIISTAVVMPLVYFCAKHINHQITFKAKITLKNVIFTCLAAIIAEIIQKIIDYVWPLSVSESGNAALVQSLHSSLWWILCLEVIVISPILEEMLFQGAIQFSIFRFCPPYIAVTVTAAIFALAHGYENWVATLSLFVNGLAFAIVYQYSKDLKMAIFCHGILNMFAILSLIV